MAQLSREELRKKISGFEGSVGGALPGDYRALLLKDGETELDANRFECMLKNGETWLGEIRYLFKFSEYPWDDIEEQNRASKKILPPRMFAIGDAGNDDKLLMSLNRNDYGGIYFWDHNEQAPQGAPPTRDNLYPVAGSLTRLLSGLTENRQMVKTRLSADRLSEQIAGFEKGIGSNLPKDYRNFLLEFNGGRPEKRVFDYHLPDERIFDSAVNRFFGFNRPEESDIEFSYGLFSHDRVPTGMFPIANDPFGNLVAMSLRPESLENIFFWDHDEESEDDDSATLDNLYFIANNFTEFFAALREEEK